MFAYASRSVVFVELDIGDRMGFGGGSIPEPELSKLSTMCEQKPIAGAVLIGAVLPWKLTSAAPDQKVVRTTGVVVQMTGSLQHLCNGREDSLCKSATTRLTRGWSRWIHCWNP